MKNSSINLPGSACSLCPVLIAAFGISGFFNFAEAQSAKFLGEDRSTQGAWSGAYGKGGYSMPHIGSSLPASVSFNVVGQQEHTWVSETSDARAPWRVIDEYRKAACWYTSQGEFNLKFKDSVPRRVSLYCLDWDGNNRSQKIEIKNALSGAVLDSRSLLNFQGGSYLRWQISGDVKIVVTNEGPVNAVVSGVFLDPITQPPAWWTSGNPPVVNPYAKPNNHGVANIGQAKWMAKSALGALRSVDAELAAEIESDLVGDEIDPGPPVVYRKAIRNWNTPTTTAEQNSQKSALLIGQLKAIAHPFYENLHAAAPNWLIRQRKAAGTLPENILLLPDGSYPSPHAMFPWPLESGASNRVPANIGQLKASFHLDFSSLPLALIDSDGDGLLDGWELGIVGFDPSDGIESINDVTPGDDFDGDGYTNLVEFLQGTNPVDPLSSPMLAPDVGLVSNLDASPEQVSVMSQWAQTDLMVVTAFDQSARKNNAVSFGASAKYLAKGGYGEREAFGFTQSGGGIQIPETFVGGMSDFSMLFFLEPTAQGLSNEVILAKGLSSTEPFSLGIQPSTGYVRVAHGAVVEMEGGNHDLPNRSSRLADHHHYTVAYTNEAGVGRLYINGERVSEHQAGALLAYSGRLNFGGSSTDGAKGWKGSEILVYNRALNAGEISKFDRFIQDKYQIADDTDRDGLKDSWEIAKWGNLLQNRISAGGDSIPDSEQGNTGELDITITSPAEGANF